jgi:hypothetical protein
MKLQSTSLALLVFFSWLACVTQSREAPGPYARFGDRESRFLRPVKDPAPDSQDVNYNCWEPIKGLSTPTVTIVTIMLSYNQAQQFVNKNRKSYILHHGYRCAPLRAFSWHTRPT